MVAVLSPLPFRVPARPRSGQPWLSVKIGGPPPSPTGEGKCGPLGRAVHETRPGLCPELRSGLFCAVDGGASRTSWGTAFLSAS